ncbi:hypothetical protein BAE44_0003191 [Dichanthelium oligosanthes]|uniref:Uncharacterized protein n=1 Tax=Dichanthelium oligosanthes TaxID=888268 RepID=A0A1E5WEI9_9POAL|nr:hypothetical protein BAE44_0003191 [Dichanthelium oligosanthes]
MEFPAPGPARKRKGRGDGGVNLLLAGLLAHEFLSSGTVLGERRGPGPGPVPQAAARYEAMAVLVHRAGVRVPGVVNPAQLAAWAGK